MSTTPYDQLPYTLRAFPHAQLRNLAAIGILRGLAPPQPSAARVLVLGCASGANLFPAACQYPNAHFSGIDYARAEIEAAQSTRRALGLDNVELQCCDILDFEGTGQFDYIIVHGVYSWVPPRVRDKIRALCAALLSPAGIAYISYNTLPGWHSHGIARDIMRYGARHATAVCDRVRQGRDYLQRLTAILPPANNPYLTQLRHIYEQRIAQGDPSYLLREYLAEYNTPFHFHDFLRELRDTGLQYLGDAAQLGRGLHAFPTAVAKALQELACDVLDFEQHADFLSNREFRCSLLCRPDNTPSDHIPPERLEQLWLSSLAKRVSLPRERFGDTIGFQNNYGGTFVDPHPAFQQAMFRIVEQYPAAVRAGELKEELQIDDAEWPLLAEKLLRARAAQVLNITVDVPAVTTAIALKPKADALARHLACETHELPTPWHENVGVDGFIRQLLPMLDGTRTREALLDAMRRLLDEGRYRAEAGMVPPLDPAAREGWLRENLERSLKFLLRSGLLSA